MRYLPGKDVAEILKGVVHAPTQQHDYETDLTIAIVYRLTGPGAIDFGGSELEPAPREEIAPRKQAESDKYGWWDLSPGTYIIRYNETIDLNIDQLAFVQPHERLIDAGAVHPTFYFRGAREAVETSLTVGSGGISIKENARASKLLIVEIGE